MLSLFVVVVVVVRPPSSKTLSLSLAPDSLSPTTKQQQKQQLRRPLQVGLQTPGQGRHGMGRRLFSLNSGVLGRRLPGKAAQSQIPRGLLSPQHLPLGHGLPVHSQRGRRVEALADCSKRAAGNPGAAVGPQPQVAGAERRLCAFREGAL